MAKEKRDKRTQTAGDLIILGEPVSRRNLFQYAAESTSMIVGIESTAQVTW